MALCARRGLASCRPLLLGPSMSFGVLSMQP